MGWDDHDGSGQITQGGRTASLLGPGATITTVSSVSRSSITVLRQVGMIVIAPVGSIVNCNITLIRIG